jgi:hypothetical protein
MANQVHCIDLEEFSLPPESLQVVMARFYGKYIMKPVPTTARSHTNGRPLNRLNDAELIKLGLPSRRKRRNK